MSSFLKGEWRKLIMANYVVDPDLLSAYLPARTEIDLWNNNCYVSLVGFMFVNTRVLGIKIPFHVNFEEVNLRFYVRHKTDHEWRRGVVFVKEIVPKSVLTFIANTLYHENYETMPMDHRWEEKPLSQRVEYRWKKNDWNTFRVKASAKALDIGAGSEEEFITEHFWGYTKVTEFKTLQYQVEHPRWQVYAVNEHEIDVDFHSVYGPTFSFLKDQNPVSVFLAKGSEITVNSTKSI